MRLPSLALQNPEHRTARGQALVILVIFSGWAPVITSSLVSGENPGDSGLAAQTPGLTLPQQVILDLKCWGSHPQGVSHLLCRWEPKTQKGDGTLARTHMWYRGAEIGSEPYTLK